MFTSYSLLRPILPKTYLDLEGYHNTLLNKSTRNKACFVCFFSVYFSNFINHLKELGLAKSYSKAAMLIRLHGGSVSIVPTSMMTNHQSSTSLLFLLPCWCPPLLLFTTPTSLCSKPPKALPMWGQEFYCGAECCLHRFHRCSKNPE